MDNKQQIIKKFFPEKKKHCAECNKRIGTQKSQRKRMLTFQQEGNLVSASAYQLCVVCAEHLAAERMYLLPNLAKDLGQAHLLAFGDHVGGVQ